MSAMEFPVTELGEADHVEVGETAPDFTRPLVTDEYWEDVALWDLLDDGPVVLVFHTVDGDFPATYVWNEIRDRHWDEYDATVVGLSISSPYEHSSFIEARDIDHALFSDPSNAVAETYGIARDLDGMTGVSEPRPAVFVIDEDGEVRYVWVSTLWPEFPDYEAIEDAIERVA